MRDDWFVNAIYAVVVMSALGLAWILGKADIANDCRAMGMTKIGQTVFECNEISK